MLVYAGKPLYLATDQQAPQRSAQLVICHNYCALLDFGVLQSREKD